MWSYSFPKALDKQNDKIKYDFKCPGGENVFLSTFDDQVLTLKLNTVANDLMRENLGCQVTLDD